jgi:hypothetical protein
MPEIDSVGTQQQQNFLCMLTGLSSWEQQSQLVSVAPELIFAERETEQTFAIKLSQINFDRKTYRLRVPLCLFLSVESAENEIWKCEDEGHFIVAFGESREAAVHSFSEDFAVLWEKIANAADDELTLDAQQIKDFLTGIVQSVDAG